jgi:preprotein translocase subunit YajC
MMCQSSFPHILILNLLREKNRREKISQQLDNLGVNYEFVTAVGGVQIGNNLPIGILATKFWFSLLLPHKKQENTHATDR